MIGTLTARALAQFAFETKSATIIARSEPSRSSNNSTLIHKDSSTVVLIVEMKTRSVVCP